MSSKDYYYNPVLPACLNSSEFLKAKYSQPIEIIYVSSNNFTPNPIWLQMEKVKVINPYKNLPSLCKNWNEADIKENIPEIEKFC